MVQKLEGGQKGFRMGTIIRIAETLGVSLGSFADMRGKDERTVFCQEVFYELVRDKTFEEIRYAGGTVSGNSAGSPSDKNTETKTEGGNGNAGKGTEPVIQTGHASPFILLAALGLCGVGLAAASVLEGKKSGKSSL